MENSLMTQYRKEYDCSDMDAESGTPMKVYRCSAWNGKKYEFVGEYIDNDIHSAISQVQEELENPNAIVIGEVVKLLDYFISPRTNEAHVIFTHDQVEAIHASYRHLKKAREEARQVRFECFMTKLKESRRMLRQRGIVAA